MAVTFLHSASPWYSTLPAVAGALITLLDQLLVTVCGWTKEYTGTNLVVYRAPGGNQRYLRVDDTNASYARVSGYVAMSGISTGSGQFPTSAQVTGGLYIDKGAGWRFLCNPAFGFYFVTKTSLDYSNLLTFTDIRSSLLTADALGTLIAGNVAANSAASNGATFTLSTALLATTGHFLAGPYTQITASTAAGRAINARTYNSSVMVMGSQGMASPSPIDGQYVISRVYVTEPSINNDRGISPGIWAPLHNKPFADLSTFAGSGELAGRTFVAVNVGGSTAGQVLFETSDTWGA